MRMAFFNDYVHSKVSNLQSCYFLLKHAPLYISRGEGKSVTKFWGGAISGRLMQARPLRAQYSAVLTGLRDLVVSIPSSKLLG